MGKCIDCGKKPNSRSKSVVRCRECEKKRRKLNSHGRTTGKCIICNTRLATKNNKTKKCFDCYIKSHIPWNKGVEGLIPWNKGKSLFKTQDEYRTHSNKLRWERYGKLSAEHKIADRVRSLIRNSIRFNATNRRKNCRTTELLGCQIAFFKQYIENLFQKGMSWENYGNGHGKWNIDHIKPISKFNLNKISEQKKAFHFTNCQSMWAIENIKKGNSF